jgi:hypothetical protein
VKFDRSLEAGTRADGSPVWWKGDDEASQSALAAARMMGVDVRGAIAAAQAG